MAFNFSPRIVTNGLVLLLDAMNPKSYVSGSTVWKDLSGNENNFTLVGNPTTDGISIQFNGTTQRGDCVNTTFGNFGSGSFTLIYVLKTDGVASNVYASPIMKRINITSIGGVTGMGWADRTIAGIFFVQDSNPTGVRANALELNYTTPLNQINYTVQVISKDSTGLIVSGSTYINNTLKATANRTFVGDGSVNNSYNARLMYSNGEGGYLSGSLYFVQAYNRELSTSEIIQNYNALKGRFGLT